tara:strand:+ start:81 stop:215 length:135 start_codon:yes stop_codon:yes gene_type:complete
MEKYNLNLRRTREKQQSKMLPFDWGVKTFDNDYTRIRNIYTFIV